mmetsp:Transcript_8038/g.10181  ORF Transcript_8038/g.10181 Transcript_8038/m.10181 type:complete len:317 (-) Transcript_8038:2334-3284(-)
MERCTFRPSNVFHSMKELKHLEIYGLDVSKNLKVLARNNSKLQVIILRNLQGAEFSWMEALILKSKLQFLCMSFHQYQYPIPGVLRGIFRGKPLLSQLVLRNAAFPRDDSLPNALSAIQGTLVSLDVGYSSVPCMLPVLPNLRHLILMGVRNYHRQSIDQILKNSFNLEYLDIGGLKSRKCPFFNFYYRGHVESFNGLNNNTSHPFSSQIEERQVTRFFSLKVLVLSGNAEVSVQTVRDIILYSCPKLSTLICNSCRGLSPVNRRKLRESKFYSEFFANREQLSEDLFEKAKKIKVDGQLSWKTELVNSLTEQFPS